jgi:ABC-2 type transport system permease protein
MRDRMGPWRLEWLRLTRSPRGLVLMLVYLFFGFTAPLLVKYFNQLAKLGSSEVQIIAPKAKPVDGIVNFVSQSSQTGLIVLIVVVAGALSFRAHTGLATFYRTRAPGPFALIWPRYVAGTAAGIAAYLAGTAAAWLETGLVLGRLPAGRLALGVLYEAVFLAFAVAVVAAAATVGRGTLATIGTAIGVLLIALPLAGAVKVVGRWLPTSLMRAPAGLLTGTAATWYLPAVAVSVVATVALLALATVRSRVGVVKGSVRPT